MSNLVSVRDSLLFLVDDTDRIPDKLFDGIDESSYTIENGRVIFKYFDKSISEVAELNDNVRIVNTQECLDMITKLRNVSRPGYEKYIRKVIAHTKEGYSTITDISKVDLDDLDMNESQFRHIIKQYLVDGGVHLRYIGENDDESK